ncbi:MAG: prepilin-type N-terminal cleavage/methylation domain-containing protein [Rhodocyclaceae bacterium]|nr:prepilin-type N-terminal cleavage/methylation domain-containing protein [Rhodocyclaceae bacterium]
MRGNSCRPGQHGFTLMELAVVMAIMALLLGGLLLPLSAQSDMRARQESTRMLTDIRDALLGYALINGKLPCPMPTTVTDPADTSYGIAAASCAPGTEGYLPWKTLGVSETDAWGNPRTLSTQPFNGYWRYRVDAAFASSFTLTTLPASALVVMDAAGNTITETTNNPVVAIVYSAGADLVPGGLNAGTPDTTYQGGPPASGFDDILIWIARPILLNRMVAAGKF